jgi:hypothetical protein
MSVFNFDNRYDFVIKDSDEYNAKILPASIVELKSVICPYVKRETLKNIEQNYRILEDEIEKNIIRNNNGNFNRNINENIARDVTRDIIESKGQKEDANLIEPYSNSNTNIGDGNNNYTKIFLLCLIVSILILLVLVL